MHSKINGFTEVEKFVVEHISTFDGEGEFRLKDVCGDLWTLLKSPTKFGKKIKAYVEAGFLNGVQLAERASNNHQYYSFG